MQTLDEHLTHKTCGSFGKKSLLILFGGSIAVGKLSLDITGWKREHCNALQSVIKSSTFGGEPFVYIKVCHCKLRLLFIVSTNSTIVNVADHASLVFCVFAFSASNASVLYTSPN